MLLSEKKKKQLYRIIRNENRQKTWGIGVVVFLENEITFMLFCIQFKVVSVVCHCMIVLFVHLSLETE